MKRRQFFCELRLNFLHPNLLDTTPCETINRRSKVEYRMSVLFICFTMTIFPRKFCTGGNMTS